MLLGRDRGTGERVTVFVMDKRLVSDGRRYLLSHRDSGIIRRTQTHDRTLSVIDVFESTHVFHVVTEAIPGQSLHDLTRNSPPLPPGTVRAVAQDVLGALAHLHAAGIVHGSVDAHSVLAGRWGGMGGASVKLLVFGVARYKHEGDVEGYTRGSRHVEGRAPEVVCFQQRSEASDVFECAVLVFHLFTGRMPFPARTDSDYLSKVSLGPDGPAWRELPAPLRGLLRDMLRDDPALRPAAAECLTHDWFVRSANVGDGQAGAACSVAGGNVGDGGALAREFAWAVSGANVARVGSDPKSVMVDMEAKLAGGKEKKL